GAAADSAAAGNSWRAHANRDRCRARHTRDALQPLAWTRGVSAWYLEGGEMSENLAILQDLTRNALARTWFEQVLRYLRVRVSDTGEEFTVVDTGNGIEIMPGFVPPQRRKVLYGLFDPGDWYAKQFIVTVTSQNV